MTLSVFQDPCVEVVTPQCVTVVLNYLETDPSAEGIFKPESLDAVMGRFDDFVRAQWAQQLGINPCYGKYLDLRALHTADIMAALASLPDSFSDVKISAIQALLIHRIRRCVGAVLSARGCNFRDGGYFEPARAIIGLSGIECLEGRSQSDLMGIRDYSGDIQIDTIPFYQIRGTQIPALDSMFPISSQKLIDLYWPNATLYNCELDLTEEHYAQTVSAHYGRESMKRNPIRESRFLACRGKISGFGEISNTFFVDFNGTIRDVEMRGCHLLNMKGHLQSSWLREGTHCEVGDDFAAEGVAMISSEVQVKGNAEFVGCGFYNTKISFADFSPSSSDVLFDTCDFSCAQLSEDDLVKVAQCGRRCRFSNEQMDVLNRKLPDMNFEKEGIGSVAVLSESLMAFLGYEWDKSNPVREGSELLRWGGKECFTSNLLDDSFPPGVAHSDLLIRGSSHSSSRDYRRVLSPVAPEELVEVVPWRVEMYKQLIKFVNDRDFSAISYQEWFDFLGQLPGGWDRVERELGFAKSLAKISGRALQHVPRIRQGESAQFLFDTRTVRPDSLSLTSIDSFTLSAGKCDSSSFYYKRERQGPITFFSLLQHTERVLFEQLGLFYQMYQYVKTLLDKGFHFPEITQDGSTVLQGLVNPNVLERCGAEMTVPNDVALDPGTCITHISAKSNGGGKSMLVDAILLAMIQAYAGLPVPAQVARISSQAAFHGVFTISSQRESRGGGGSLGGRDGTLATRIAQMQKIEELVLEVARAHSGSCILVALDEMIQGATDSGPAFNIDVNFPADLIRKVKALGCRVCFLTVGHQAKRMVASWRCLLGDAVVVSLASDGENKFSFHSGPPVDSSPDAVLLERGLPELAERRDWHV